MRDIFVFVVVLGSLPFIVRLPWVGVLVWSWLGYMNPHRLAWGFVRDMPVAQMVAIATLIGLVAWRESKKVPWTRETITLTVLILWMLVTTLDAFYPELAWIQYQKVLKIQLMTFVTLMLMKEPVRLRLLVWVIALSLGFYGVKGGIFTITTGGSYHVRGPDGTFIGGNNEIGLALIMTLPLMRFLQLTVARAWLRHGFSAAMFFTFVAILGTQSRGALVGVAAMAFMLTWKSRRRFGLLLVWALLVPVGLAVMPESWYERMHTIQTYEEDRSFQGRLRAWANAITIAGQEPLTGGGFEALRGGTDAHSIYFEVLGEHGYVGLALFLTLGAMTWRSAGRVRREATRRADLKWMADLAAMTQVSLIGYAASGAFLGLAYFDLGYHLVAIVVILRYLLARELAASPLPAREHTGPAVPAGPPVVPRQLEVRGGGYAP